MAGIPSRIAIIVPAYNEEHVLPACLQSLQNQRTRAKIEVIVVDNASTDRTSDIAQGMADRVVRCDARGRLNAIRRGLAATDACIVAFADADTEYPVTWIERLRVAFTDKRVQLVFGPSTQGLAPGMGLTVLLKLYELWISISLARNVVCSVGFNMAVRRSAAKAVVADLDAVALNDWALGSAICRRYGRRSINYVADLIVPKCMRRYQRDGWWRTTLIPMQEWLRVIGGRSLTVDEREYHGF